MTLCLLPAQTGTATLSAPDAFPALADLPLTCHDGWSLEQLQIGFPDVRAVSRVRALADGVYDDTFFLGARAVTLTLRIASATATQAALDAIMPFLSPRIRPVLTWSLAGSPTNLRSLTLRGVDAPVVIDGPSYQRVVVSFVSTESFMRSGDEHCVAAIAQPNLGRTYDLTFDRVYSSTSPTVQFTVNNAGNAPAPWRATINADAVNPSITVNGLLMSFSQNGGVTLTGGDQLFVSVDQRLAERSPFPLTPVYDRMNFYDWRWDNFLLLPGPNLIEFAIAPGGDSLMTFCWHDTWL